MFIIEFIYTVFYVLLIIVMILLAIALAIPFALLFLVYWLLFKSWRKKKVKTVYKNKEKKFDSKSIRNIISKSMKLKDSTDEVESEELKKEIDEIAKTIKKSVGVETEE